MSVERADLLPELPRYDIRLTYLLEVPVKQVKTSGTTL